MLAADRLAGDFFSPELLQQLDPSLVEGREGARPRDNNRRGQERQYATRAADAGSGSLPDRGI